MSEFRGLCETCGLWFNKQMHESSGLLWGQCPISGNITNADTLCCLQDERLATIRSLVTSPDFVPEEVQEMIVEAARRPLVEEIYPFGPLESEESK